MDRLGERAGRDRDRATERRARARVPRDVRGRRRHTARRLYGDRDGERAGRARAPDVGARARAGWRPVSAHDLLPERALHGDAQAIDSLVEEVYVALRSTDPALIETVAAYLERAGSLEGAARELFVHPNTVRYRLRRVADVTGLTPTVPRDAWSLRLALSLGRLADDRPPT